MISNIKFVLVAGIFISFFCGCKQTASRPDVPVLSVELGKQRCPAETYFDDIRPVYFECTSESLLKNVPKMIRYKDRFILFERNQQALMFFDTTGQHIHSVFPSGRGPGEYMQATSFMLDRKAEEVILLCDPGKWMFFDLNGNFKREIGDVKSYWEIVQDNNNNMLCVNFLGKDEYLYLVEAPFVKADSGRSLNMKDGHPVTHLPGDGSLATKGVNVNIAQRFNNCIYSWDGKELYPRYVMDFKSYNYPEELAAHTATEEGFLRTLREKPFIFGMINIKETPGYMFFLTNQPGIFVIDKDQQTTAHCDMLSLSPYGFATSTYLPVEDEENRLLGAWCRVAQAKAIILYSSMKDKLPAGFKAKVEALPEDANPILFLLKSKK